MQQGKANSFAKRMPLVIPNTLFQQRKRPLYTWTSPDGQHQSQIGIQIVAKDGESVCSQEKQDLELTVDMVISLS